MSEKNDFFRNLKNLCIVTGHFGAGKTNFAVNLALEAKKHGRDVTLIDMDIINPYFRAADNKDALLAANIRCIMPEYANTNVDIPALPPEILSAFEVYEQPTDRLTVFDVGGDNGAVALGVYHRFFVQYGYDMLYCANRYRKLTETVEDAADIIREIEVCSRLKMTGIVNTSNLGAETTADDIIDSLDWADRLCACTGLPLTATVAERRLADSLTVPTLFPIDNITKKLY